MANVPFKDVSMERVRVEEFRESKDEGIRVFIVGCVWNAKSQLQRNRVFWRLGLATGMSRKFELRAKYLAN